MTSDTPTRDWDGAAYHRVSDPQFSWGMRVLDRLELRGDETVVDAGCGSGRLTAELLQRLPSGRVIAVDRSPSMLEVAGQELRPRWGDRVTLLQSDLLELALEGVADVVFSTATFHWVLDHPTLFARLHRALRPGGRLEAQCGGAGNLDRIRGRAARLLARPEFAPFFEGFTSPWLYADDAATADRLTAAGFVEVETWLEPALTVLPDEPTYRSFVGTVILRPYLERLNDPVLRERLLDAMCAEAAGDDPPWSLDYRRLNMSARSS